MINVPTYAKVANSLLRVYQRYTKGIRFLLIMFLTLTVTTNAWAEDATISFASATQRVSQDNNKQVWSNDGITFTNNKAASTSNVGSNTNPVRLYANSEIIITHTSQNIDKIYFDCNSSAYATALSNSIGTPSNATKNVSSDKVTLTFTNSVASYTIAKLTAQVRLDNITVTYTSGGGVTPDPCTTPTVAWNTKPANGEVDGSMTASVTTNYSNGLTYSSSNQTVATVTNAGVINYLSAGTTTITATVTGDGTTFCEGPVSVQQEITVTAPAGGDGGDSECTWELVTDASTLKADDEIIIAASGDNNYALSTNQKSSNRGGTTITKNGNTLTAPSADVQILTLKAGSTSGTFAFYTGTSGYLYAASSSSNQLKTKETLDVHGSWTISITDGVASIAATGSSNRNVMQYNYNNGSPLFACYASASQTSLAIYKKICSDDGGDDPTPTPTLNVDPATLTFGNTTTNTSTQKTFTLTGSNLTANASLQLSGINPGMFSLSSNSVTQSAGSINQTITVTYTPTATGSHNAILTISSTGAESKTVTLSGTGVAPAAKYTVTFNAGSGTCGTESLAEESAGAGVTLPTANPPATCATDGWKFAGWWTGSVAETTTSPGELLTANSNYKPTSDCTLYAVYSHTEAGGGGSGFYLSVTKDDDTYYIGEKGSGAFLSAVTDINSAATFNIENNQYLYYGNKTYVSSTSDNTSLTIATTTPTVTWAITDEGETITFKSNGTGGRYLAFNYNNGSPRFSSYGSTYTYELTKHTTSTTTYNSNPVCVASWSITYDFAGGTGSHCSNTSVPQGNTYTICDEAPTREGHTFLGWSDGTSTYDAGATITPTGDVTLTAQWQVSTYTVTWSVNGATTTIPYNHGATLTLPTAPASCDGVKEFVGWTALQADYYHATTAPTDLFTTASGTVTANTTYYAVFATPPSSGGAGSVTTVDDVLTRATTGISNGAGYGTWSDKKVNSAAVYAGQSAGGNDAIQIRSKESNSGIVTTTSGGKATRVEVEWEGNTTSGRTLDIYGRNVAYNAATDLYNNSTQGTKLGSIVYESSTELEIQDDYEYIGLRSKDGAMYLTSVTITWSSGSGSSSGHTDYTTICQEVTGIAISGSYPTTFVQYDAFSFAGGTVTATLENGSTADVTSQATFSGYNLDNAGTQTVTVTYMGFSVKYEITVTESERWRLTWNVNGKTNTGASPIYVQKGAAIGKLPTPAVPASCAGKTFIGWTTSNIVPSDGVGITYIDETTVPTGNTTYYAVFASINNFSTQKPITEIQDGAKVVIVAVASLDANGGTGKAISSLATDDTHNLIGDDVTISDQTINTPHSTCVWTVNKSDNKYIFTQDGKYLYGLIDGKYSNLKYGTTSDSWTMTAAISGMTMTYNMKSTNASTEYIEWYNEKFTIHNEVNSNGAFDMQFFVTANASGTADTTDYTTGCEEYTITYYGFNGGYSTSCSSDGTIVLPVNSQHTIPNCTGLVIKDHSGINREFTGKWMTEPHGGHTFLPGETFTLTQDTTLYAQWKLETTGDITLPTDVDDMAGTDIYVYGGKTLTIQPGTTTINSLTLKGGLQDDGSYAMPNIWVPAGATLIRNNDKIYLDLVVNAKNYYPFAVPFTAKNGSSKNNWNYVGYLDAELKAAATYGTHFVIKTYDGSLRAKNGEDRKNNWVKVNRDTNLEPGTGYIITAMTRSDKDTATIRIPMKVANTWFANGEQAVVGSTERNTMTVTAHTGDAANEHPRHAGWNMVANPYLSYFAGGNVIGDGTMDFIDGELIINSGFNYGGEAVPYVTIPAYDFSYYTAHKLSDIKLSPEYSFFVQIGTSGTMNFTTEGRQQAPAALRSNMENPRIETDIVISHNKKTADHTGLIIDDRYTTAYEIGADLEKMFGSAYNTTIYTLGNDVRLAYNALSHIEATIPIPLGFRAETDGEYTISLTNPEDIFTVESFVLQDCYNNTTTNLLLSDYTFYTDRTQDDQRFVVYIVPHNNAPTDISTIIDNDTETRKVIYNNHLYIIHNGHVYDGVGQTIQ